MVSISPDALISASSARSYPTHIGAVSPSSLCAATGLTSSKMRGFALLSLLAGLAAARYRSSPLPQIEHYIPTDRRYLVRRHRNKATVFEHTATQSKLEYVSNSGVCETTSGVTQHSGYISVGENMNMWFWMFEARKDAANAPLVAWFNGGNVHLFCKSTSP